MHGGIHLRDVLLLMEERGPRKAPLAFDLEHYTYNQKTKEGGKLMVLEGARLNVPDAKPAVADLRGATRPGAAEQPKANDGRRKPDHFGHATRDVLLADGAVHRVKIFLITKFNGQPVYL